jgi:NAD-dependent DNA ligase
MPEQDWEWNETEVDAVSVEYSPKAEMLRVKSFFTSFKIDNLGDASIQKLIDVGYEEIFQILNLNELGFVSYLGKNGKKTFDSIQANLHQCDMATLMGAWPYFGRGFGRRKAKMMLDVIDDWQNATLEQLVEVDGWSEKTASIFLKGRTDFIQFFNTSSKYGLLLVAEREIKEVINGPLTGVNFVFTGYRPKNNEDVLLEELGAVIQDGVKKDTTYLVAKDPGKSSNKLQKAREQGIIVINPVELQNLINSHKGK